MFRPDDVIVSVDKSKVYNIFFAENTDICFIGGNAVSSDLTDRVFAGLDEPFRMRQNVIGQFPFKLFFLFKVSGNLVFARCGQIGDLLFESSFFSFDNSAEPGDFKKDGICFGNGERKDAVITGVTEFFGDDGGALND